MRMPIPNKVTCPICGNSMDKMESQNQDLKLSGISVKIGNDRKYLGTTIFLCSKCHNSQSFIEFEPD